MADPTRISLPELRVPLRELAPRETVDHRLKPRIARKLCMAVDQIADYRIVRRSLDARKKPRLEFVYQLEVRLHGSPEWPERGLDLDQLELAADRPRQAIVVGTGPAGLLAAYLLTRHGVRVLVVDRGYDVERRAADIATFHASRALHPDSNYLFGEGGAGTYSDGKLYTRVKDRRMQYLLRAFVDARAPRAIWYQHHPHIGSDLLPHMIRRLRQQIIDWGGEFRWGAEVVEVLERDGRCHGVRLADGQQLEAEVCLLAVGHSARGLLRRLVERGLAHQAKGYQLGCRIEHPQELIDRGQYGFGQPPPYLGAAEYHLVSRPPAGRAASTTTFCMCPGGEIIAATSDPGQLSTNGMSRHARNSGLANAGLIVNQPVDRGGSALAALDQIDALERACFHAGGGDYSCPAQAASAFVCGETGALPARVSYDLGVRPGRLDQLLPAATRQALVAALQHFERKIPGFLRQGTLVGLETRVSSPLRFERDPDTLASSLPGCWLLGEGAGYAGGIVSAGLDGLRVAERLLIGPTVG